MEKSLGIRKKGSLNETQGRNESVTGPGYLPKEESMSEPYQRMISGYRVYKTRASTLAYIAQLEADIEKRIETYRAIKAERSPTPEERRQFLLTAGLRDFVARARFDLKELPA
jgi:hypothetical protein